MMEILTVVQSVCEEFEKCQLHESLSIHTEREHTTSYHNERLYLPQKYHNIKDKKLFLKTFYLYDEIIVLSRYYTKYLP